MGSPILNECNIFDSYERSVLDKFEGIVESGGIIIKDSSLVERIPIEKTYRFMAYCYKGSLEMGNPTFANIILLGKLIEVTKIISKEAFEKA